MAKSKPEKKIQSDILKALKAMPHVWATSHTATMYTGKGHPDIYGCYYGIFFAFEVKCPGKKPTEIQKAVIDTINKAFGFACVVTSVKEALDELQAMHNSVRNLAAN